MLAEIVADVPRELPLGRVGTKRAGNPEEGILDNEFSVSSTLSRGGKMSRSS
jgi:hypothetical protein